MYKDKDKQKQAQREASKRYRAKGMTQEGMTGKGMTQARTASYQDYLDNPDDYAERTRPDRLNWGEYMTWPELQAANLVANRVRIPGDWDYASPTHESMTYPGKASTPYTQATWDKHAAQGRPCVC